MSALHSIILLAGIAAPPADTADCVAAARFLREDRRMVAVVERDTFDDWRTRKRVPGCRITSAGATDIGVAREAVRFYERVRATGWTRTPDPADAPNEASLRFRQGGSDCLFNVNALAMLNTVAEEKVNELVTVPSGQARYHVFVMCMPAMPAAASLAPEREQ
ncbi:MAG: hypothetical protein V4617_10720 [Gemmatimonadota bacterium]